MSETTANRVSRFALVGAALLAIGAIGTKFWRDRAPDTATSPATQSPATAAAPARPDLAATIGALEAKLKAAPNDAEGWGLLGSTLFQGQRFADAAKAYRRATVLKPDNADYWSSLGESLVSAGPGDVPPEAKTAFTKAVAIDANDPRGRYFLAVARDIGGDHRGAIDDWFALLGDSPAGAPWEPDVRRTIEAVAAKNKINVASRLAALRPQAAGPGTASAASALAQLPPDAQQEMIAGMVAGLATKLKANPENVEGWIMLMRSYTTLGRSSDAGAAYRAAVAANPGARRELDAAAKTLGVAK